MSKQDTIVFTGPDGMYYELPREVAAKYLVPPHKVPELRKRLGESAAPSNGAHYKPTDALPADIPPPPPELLAAIGRAPDARSTVVGTPSASTTIATPNGGTVVLNFIFAPPGAAPAASASAASESGVEGYHMSFDANGIPTNHVDLLWGDYIDKQGNPAVGWHSHDPVTGNAQ